MPAHAHLKNEFTADEKCHNIELVQRMNRNGVSLFLVLLLFFIWAATWQNQQNNCAPSEDSDQPGHLPSLLRVFAVRMKKAWVLGYPLATHWAHSADSDQTEWMPRLIWVFAGLSVILFVLSCVGSFIVCLMGWFWCVLFVLFVIVFFVCICCLILVLFSIVMGSLGEERVGLYASRVFVCLLCMLYFLSFFSSS